MRQPSTRTPRASACALGAALAWLASDFAQAQAQAEAQAQAQARAEPTPEERAPVANRADGESTVPRALRNALAGPDAEAAPRVTRTDLPLNAPAAPGALAGFTAASLQPSSVRVSELSYRWWISRGRTDWGVGVGALALTARPLGASPGDSPILLNSSPSVTLGMRYRASPQSTVFADASSAPGLLGATNGDAYIGKVGVEWKPASLASRWNLSYGGIGWRLNADSRMTLRVKSGGVGLYMRSQF